MSRAAAFRTRYSGLRVDCGTPANKELRQSSLEMMSASKSSTVAFMPTRRRILRWLYSWWKVGNTPAAIFDIMQLLCHCELRVEAKHEDLERQLTAGLCLQQHVLSKWQRSSFASFLRFTRDPNQMVPGRFATLPVRYLDVSPPGRFAPLNVSIPGLFATSLNVSPPVSKLVMCDTVTTSANLFLYLIKGIY